MTKRFPPPPLQDAPLAGARPSIDARTLLALRKSANKLVLCDPGPTESEIDELLIVAARVPDHRKLGPWRFVVLEGDARKTFGVSLGQILRARLCSGPDRRSREIDDPRAGRRCCDLQPGG